MRPNSADPWRSVNSAGINPTPDASRRAPGTASGIIRLPRVDPSRCRQATAGSASAAHRRGLSPHRRDPGRMDNEDIVKARGEAYALAMATWPDARPEEFMLPTARAGPRAGDRRAVRAVRAGSGLLSRTMPYCWACSANRSPQVGTILRGHHPWVCHSQRPRCHRILALSRITEPRLPDSDHSWLASMLCDPPTSGRSRPESVRCPAESSPRSMAGG